MLYSFFLCSSATTIEETNQSVEPVSEMQCLRLLSSAAEYYKNKIGSLHLEYIMT